MRDIVACFSWTSRSSICGKATGLTQTVGVVDCSVNVNEKLDFSANAMFNSTHGSRHTNIISRQTTLRHKAGDKAALLFKS